LVISETLADGYFGVYRRHSGFGNLCPVMRIAALLKVISLLAACSSVVWLMPTPKLFTSGESGAFTGLPPLARGLSANPGDARVSCSPIASRVLRLAPKATPIN
jgi:hypothetical protein